MLFRSLRIGEISCPTRYFAEASSINFKRSVVYGLGVLATSVAYRLDVWGLKRHRIFSPTGRRLSASRLLDSQIVSPPAADSV